MNDEIKEKLKMKIAISQIKNEEEKAMNEKEKFVFKNVGIVACVLMSLTGVAFAGNKIIENIWKTPEKIQNEKGIESPLPPLPAEQNCGIHCHEVFILVTYLLL